MTAEQQLGEHQAGQKLVLNSEGWSLGVQSRRVSSVRGASWTLPGRQKAGG